MPFSEIQQVHRPVEVATPPSRPVEEERAQTRSLPREMPSDSKRGSKRTPSPQQLSPSPSPSPRGSSMCCLACTSLIFS